jgi:hypothetical protein
MTTNFDNLRRWYSGKALITLDTYVIPTLKQAEQDEAWPTGASRKVRAALNKQTVAIKFANANERKSPDGRILPRDETTMGLLDDVSDNRARYWDAKLRSAPLVHAMMFGQFTHAPKLIKLAQDLLPHCATNTERAALATALQWTTDNAPVAELVARLDATRPKPVYVFAAISKTIYASVSTAMGIDFTSIASPKITWDKVKTTIAGKTAYIWVPTIHWPAGTKHNTSKFSYGSKAGNDQCQACGHAIRNNYNWVPLLATTTKGPVSLWVGRDCAESLFGCKITAGSAEFAQRLNK